MHSICELKIEKVFFVAFFFCFPLLLLCSNWKKVHIYVPLVCSMHKCARIFQKYRQFPLSLCIFLFFLLFFFVCSPPFTYPRLRKQTRTICVCLLMWNGIRGKSSCYTYVFFSVFCLWHADKDEEQIKHYIRSYFCFLACARKTFPTNAKRRRRCVCVFSGCQNKFSRLFWHKYYPLCVSNSLEWIKQAWYGCDAYSLIIHDDIAYCVAEEPLGWVSEPYI